MRTNNGSPRVHALCRTLSTRGRELWLGLYDAIAIGMGHLIKQLKDVAGHWIRPNNLHLDNKSYIFDNSAHLTQITNDEGVARWYGLLFIPSARSVLISAAILRSASVE